MKLYIVNKSSRSVPRKFLESWVKRLGREIAGDVDPARFKRKELGLIFLSDQEGRELNRTYREMDYATDVLSFEGDAEATLGELVICPDVIHRQAIEHGLLFREELGYMVIHGFLHLIGFEHERGGAEAERMYQLQDRLFDDLCAHVRGAGRKQPGEAKGRLKSTKKKTTLRSKR